MQSLIHRIVLEINFCHKLVKGHGSHSMHDFKVTQLFKTTARSAMIHFGIHLLPWIKINVDGSTVDNPPYAAIPLVCRDHLSGFLGGLVQQI
jgi:hypothetical protein